MAPSLTNVEAQRIMAILEETYLKLQLLSHVPPLRRVPDFDSFTNEVGPEVAQVLDEQVLLEQQYKWVSTPQHEQAEAGFEGEQALPDFETLDDELRHSTRVVCRMLREAPGISAQLKEMDPEGPSGVMRKLLATVLELKSQTFQKLSTSVEEEKSKEDWFLEISAREEKASQTLRQLQKEIKLEKAERERQVSARSDQIQKLKDELNEIKTSTINVSHSTHLSHAEHSGGGSHNWTRCARRLDQKRTCQSTRHPCLCRRRNSCRPTRRPRRRAISLRSRRRARR